MVVSKSTHTRLPFVEKYRPKMLEELASHQEIISTITKMVDDRKIPHFLFYGPPGTGKTTTILAMAHRLFGEKEYHSYVVELNASDDRGIDVVRNNIIRFADTAALDHNTNRDSFKLIILDEADNMTKDAQNALKRVIEKYARNVRFCLICNHLSGIIPAIQSRCTRFRFSPLAKNEIMPRLEHVIHEEKLNVTEDGKEALYNLSGGDMRKILNILQSTSLAFDIIYEKNVYACVGQPDPHIIKQILKVLLGETIEHAIEKITQIQLEYAVSLTDILENITDDVLALKFIDDNISANLIEHLSEIQKRVRNGCSEDLQLNALVAAFVLARDEIFS